MENTRELPCRGRVIAAFETFLMQRVYVNHPQPDIIRAALELLKEQEALTIHDPGAICPNCKWPLYPDDHPKYCGNCGRAVKWNAD